MRRTGIDVGSTAVRLVEVSGLDGDALAKVTKVHVEPLPPGAFSAGRIKDRAQVAFALRNAIKAAKVSSYGVVLGLACPDTAIARITMPASLKPAEWAEVLRLQDRSLSPQLPIKESSLSFLALASDPGGEDPAAKQEILAAAALTSDVDEVLATARAAKVTPRVMDLSGSATVRCMARVAPGASDVATVVDIGATKVMVATRAGALLRSVRTLELGGEEITRSIMGATGESYEVAERRKLSVHVGTQDMSAAQALEQVYGLLEDTRVSPTSAVGTDVAAVAATKAAEKLVDRIAQAVESDTARHPEAPTQGLVLCGGGALLQGLKELVQDSIGVPTVLGRPWAVLVPGKGTAAVLDSGHEAETMLSLSTAIGLASWGVS